MCKAAKCARQSAAVRAKEKNDRYLGKRIEIAERKGDFAGVPFHDRRLSTGERVWAF